MRQCDKCKEEVRFTTDLHEIEIIMQYSLFEKDGLRYRVCTPCYVKMYDVKFNEGSRGVLNFFLACCKNNKGGLYKK